MSGISGVGKDFTLAQLKEFKELEFNKIHAGGYISQEFKNHPELSSEFNIDKAFDEIEKEMFQNFGRVALNCHMIYGIFPELYSNKDRLLKIPHKKILIIEKDPEAILSQRKRDKSRVRPLQTIDDIYNTQKISTRTATEISREKSSELKIFNPDIENIENIVDFLE